MVNSILFRRFDDKIQEYAEQRKKVENRVDEINEEINEIENKKNEKEEGIKHGNSSLREFTRNEEYDKVEYIAKSLKGLKKERDTLTEQLKTLKEKEESVENNDRIEVAENEERVGKRMTHLYNLLAEGGDMLLKSRWEDIKGEANKQNIESDIVYQYFKEKNNKEILELLEQRKITPEKYGELQEQVYNDIFENIRDEEIELGATLKKTEGSNKKVPHENYNTMELYTSDDIRDDFRSKEEFFKDGKFNVNTAKYASIVKGDKNFANYYVSLYELIDIFREEDVYASRYIQSKEYLDALLNKEYDKANKLRSGYVLSWIKKSLSGDIKNNILKINDYLEKEEDLGILSNWGKIREDLGIKQWTSGLSWKVLLTDENYNFNDVELSDEYIGEMLRKKVGWYNNQINVGSDKTNIQEMKKKEKEKENNEDMRSKQNFLWINGTD